MTTPRKDDDQPIAGLAGLKQVTPPASLVAAVMSQLHQPRRVSFWSWLVKPRRIELRVSPLPLLAVSALGLTALLLWPRAGGAPMAPVQTASAAPALVQVRFVLVARGAKKVAVAGDFNGWDAQGTPLENADGDGTFVATVTLPRGAHEYMFLVDGQWLTDPAAAESRPDGFGRNNSILRL